jgi:L-seryl-tRNA(Ser) seleniumtransferase
MISEPLRELPAVDKVIRTDIAQVAIERFGRPIVVAAVQRTLAETRVALRQGRQTATLASEVAAAALARIEADTALRVRRVFNLTGTVLHTNLGRATLAEEAVAAASTAMREAIALEFDLSTGRRGERDDLVRTLLCELTGAEDATIVNNNAAAVLLVLNTLGKGREAIVSRGELIEIGGAFRLPDIMTRAGVKLREVGTTNRTHLSDYVASIGSRTGLVLKVHTSNYWIEGFTKEVPTRELAPVTREHQVPLVHDLGSGTLVDFSRYGLAHEPTVAESIAAGSDLVTFSGDKLLGGPQAGFIVGRADFIAKVNRNPMKRALRVDKIRLAAVEATLQLYRDPERLAARLPVMRHVTRAKGEITALAGRLLAPLTAALGDHFSLEVVECASQIGSGALPQQTLPSAGIGIRPSGKRASGRSLATLAARLRGLSIPVIGRVADDMLVLDLRCLDDEIGFVRNLVCRPVDAGSSP